MERNEASPVKQTDLVVISNPNRPLKFRTFDPSTADVKTFLDEIESPSWKRRFNAHREITARGRSGDEHVRTRFLKAQTGSPAWHTLAWLAGRHNDQRVAAALTQAISSANGQTASTAADILRRFHGLSESKVKSLLAHESPIAQLAGLRAAADSELREAITRSRRVVTVLFARLRNAGLEGTLPGSSWRKNSIRGICRRAEWH